MPSPSRARPPSSLALPPPPHPPRPPSSQFTDKKFTHAATTSVDVKERSSAGGASGGGGPRLDAVLLADRKMLTPQMRQGLYDNAQKLRPHELKDLRSFALKLCAASVEDVAGTQECKIDPDVLDPKSFFVLDTHIRKLIASRPAV